MITNILFLLCVFVLRSAQPIQAEYSPRCLYVIPAFVCYYPSQTDPDSVVQKASGGGAGLIDICAPANPKRNKRNIRICAPANPKRNIRRTLSKEEEHFLNCLWYKHFPADALNDTCIERFASIAVIKETAFDDQWRPTDSQEAPTAIKETAFDDQWRQTDSQEAPTAYQKLLTDLEGMPDRMHQCDREKHKKRRGTLDRPLTVQSLGRYEMIDCLLLAEKNLPAEASEKARTVLERALCTEYGWILTQRRLERVKKQVSRESNKTSQSAEASQQGVASKGYEFEKDDFGQHVEAAVARPSRANSNSSSSNSSSFRDNVGSQEYFCQEDEVGEDVPLVIEPPFEDIAMPVSQDAEKQPNPQDKKFPFTQEYAAQYARIREVSQPKRPCY